MKIFFLLISVLSAAEHATTTSGVSFQVSAGTNTSQPPHQRVSISSFRARSKGGERDRNYTIHERENPDKTQVFYRIFDFYGYSNMKNYLSHDSAKGVFPHNIDYIEYKTINKTALVYFYASKMPLLVSVAKKTTESEFSNIISILEFLQFKTIEKGTTWPQLLVLPECHFNFKSELYTLYHAAQGISVYDKLLACSSDDSRNDLLEIMQNIGSGLYRLHHYLRPNEHELKSSLKDNQKKGLRVYVDCVSNLQSKKLDEWPDDILLTRFLLSVNHGDVHPGNIFVNDRKKIFFIDYASMARDLPQNNGPMSVTNDVAYFVFCTFCYYEKCYRSQLDGDFLALCMVHFLAGYLVNIPEQYRSVILQYVFLNYSFLLEELMFNACESYAEKMTVRTYYEDYFNQCISPGIPRVINTIMNTMQNTAQQKIAKTWRQRRQAQSGSPVQ